MLKRHYAGWRVYDNGENCWPSTGRFTAERFGVRLSASTEELIINMIEQRIKQYPDSYRA